MYNTIPDGMLLRFQHRSCPYYLRRNDYRTGSNWIVFGAFLRYGIAHFDTAKEALDCITEAMTYAHNLCLRNSP